MKSIQIDDDLYHFIASQTQHIGESASDILRRLVMPDSVASAKSSSAEAASPQAQQDSDYDSLPVCQAQAVFDELDKQQLQAVPKMVDRWLKVLSVMHKHHSAQFAKVLGMSGRNRTYFALDKDTLLETGSSTNPKNVPDSPYWVITNNNTVKKINMLKEVALVVGFTDTEITRLLSIFAPEHLD
ncbi:replication initiation negative regulator SeqA [Paraglaciecola aestuariivivens]